MTMDKSILHHFIKDALVIYSEDFRIRDRGNPVTIDLNGSRYSIHISYIHDSGKARSNEDEARIQISRNTVDLLKVRFDEGNKVAFVGFFEKGNVFVAWDPRYVFSLQTTSLVSVYARKSQEQGAMANSASVHQFPSRSLDEESLAIALPSRAFGFYLENIDKFHRLKSEENIQQVIHEQQNVTVSAKDASNSIKVKGQRERFTYTSRTFPRDPNFRNRVLSAYNGACCICQRQLGIVQAAHIIPHSEQDSTNNVSNGLALCIEHHRLYDDALLLPGPGRKLVFNDERADFLRQTNQGRGLDEIEARRETRYSVPRNSKLRPSEEYLQRGLEIRMGA